MQQNKGREEESTLLSWSYMPSPNRRGAKWICRRRWDISKQAGAKEDSRSEFSESDATSRWA